MRKRAKAFEDAKNSALCNYRAKIDADERHLAELREKGLI